MPTICNDCKRFLAKDEGYLQHLDAHNEAQETVFGSRWIRDVSMGDCRYIVRHGHLYEHRNDGWWYDSKSVMPAIRHHEWLPL